ncbi:BnaCnng74940D [Brassica napus]|uniref:BnaCnng74940D protein n=1 Tax=Brassica napus TaxID=3708 RepID=A0A078K1U8_BRANA|nr:BnaCnng74940D [Brassica napus]
MLQEHFSLNKWNLLHILSEAYHGYGDDCFFVKLSSSLLWFQIYGLRASIAHTIKNANAHHSRAVCNLKAFRGRAVTPIQNGSFDLYSLMTFLRFEPFSIKSYWQSLIQHPLGQGNKNRLSRLQVLMATTSLRRTKEKSLIGLPPKINVRYMITWKEKPKLYDDASLYPPELRSLNTLTSIEDVTDKSELLQKPIAILQDGEDLRF